MMDEPTGATQPQVRGNGAKWREHAAGRAGGGGSDHRNWEVPYAAPS